MKAGVYVHTGGSASDPGAVAVVLLHGAGMDHTGWRFQSRWLANRGYRVLAPDLPGHGASLGPPLTSIVDGAEWLAELIGDGGPEPVTLVGHSMGALISLETAASHPDLVERLVLVGASPRMTVHPALMAAARSDGGRAAQLIAGWSFPAAHGGGHPEPGTWEHGGLARLVERSAEGVLATDLAACEAYDAAAAASRLTTETLLVSGSEDRMTPAKGAKELAALIPGARLTVLPHAGHEPMVQFPRRFNGVLEEFLTSSGKAPSR